MTQGAQARSPDSTDPALRAVLRDVARASIRTPPPALVADRYRIGEPLGNGGMGTVYRATDERLGRPVALKWMHFHDNDGVSDEAFRRFVREARAAAMVRHPNVVHVLDVSAEASTPFITMELLEGESLRVRLARGRMSWSEAALIAQGMLDGLGALHAAGVVHRDIKPSNVFLGRSTGTAALVKVLDLGVAHIKEGEGLGALTRTGTPLGTPAYMPLEQLRGESVDARADLYAVGVVLYEMLAGVRPFSARTAADLAVQMATSRAPDLSASSGVSAQQNSVLQRALSRAAAQRFQSAEAFTVALAYVGHARPPFLRRGGLWILAVLIGGGVAMAVTQWERRPPDEPSGTIESRSPETAAPPPVERPPQADSVPVAEAPVVVHDAPVGDAQPTVVVTPDTDRAAIPPNRGRHHARAATVTPAATQRQEPTPEATRTSPRLDVSEFERQAPSTGPSLRRDEF